MIFCFSLIPFFSYNQEVNNEELKAKGSFIRFEPSEINLGKIPSTKVTEESGNIELTVHNDGKLPLILNQVTACCGTRVNEWPRQPIPPGGKGTIKASFRMATHAHRISRTITVVSNAANGGEFKIPITGEVIIPSEVKEIQLHDSRL